MHCATALGIPPAAIPLPSCSAVPLVFGPPLDRQITAGLRYKQPSSRLCICLAGSHVGSSPKQTPRSNASNGGRSRSNAPPCAEAALLEGPTQE